jgi:hypothetical protein
MSKAKAKTSKNEKKKTKPKGEVSNSKSIKSKKVETKKKVLTLTFCVMEENKNFAEDFYLRLKNPKRNETKKTFKEFSLKTASKHIDDAISELKVSKQENKDGSVCVKIENINEINSFELIKCLVTSFNEVFKYSYFDKNIDNYQADDFMKNILLCAICMFDKDIDEAVITRQFLILLNESDEETKTINFESFFSFRLKSIEERYAELAGLLNENIEEFFESDIFFDFLRFLLSSFPIIEEEVVIDFAQKEFELTDIFELIKKSPERIIIKNMQDENKVDVVMIIKLFDERVYIMEEE